MKKLHKLRTNDLTNNEAGQFIKTNLADFEKTDIDIEADTFLKANPEFGAAARPRTVWEPAR